MPFLMILCVFTYCGSEDDLHISDEHYLFVRDAEGVKQILKRKL